MNGIGNRAKYTCNPGFKRETDDPYTVCQANGTWSITPKCVKGKFPEPKKLKHAK
jgi:hypothetical protein